MGSKKILPFLLAILFYLFSFPETSPVYGTGLDPSYTWALNWLFVHDRLALTNMLYSIGPLGFLKFPTTEGYNLVYFYLFFSFLKILFLSLLLLVAFETSGLRKYMGIGLTFVVSFFLDLDILLIGNCFLLVYLFLKHHHLLPFLLASLLCAMAILIKSSIGISCLSLMISSLGLHFFLVRSVKQTSLYLAAFIISYSIPLLLVFGNFEKSIAYHYNIRLLSEGYSSALALQTRNNWWVLTGFLLCFGIAPFIFKNKDIKILFPLLLFPLFAMWKHAMGREDISHNSIFLYALFMLWPTILILTKEFNVKTISLAVLSIGFYFSNMTQIYGWESYQFTRGGIQHFYTSIVEFSKTNKIMDSISRKDIAQDSISPASRALIGNSTIDVYPWELSYIPANQLRWKPRRTFELSASSTRYISKETSKSYLPPNAPEFILFHLITDHWGGRFGSMDGRYILNDEPNVVHAILNHYTLAEKNPQYLLFRKSDKKMLTVSKPFSKQGALWNDWITIPPVSGKSLLRIRFNHTKTILGKLKNFIYKDEAYYIDYLFSPDSILSYRFVPSNAADGLWLHPFILNPQNNATESTVQKIRFRHSASSLLVEDSIHFQWESTELASSVNTTSSSLELFHKADPVSEKIIVHLSNHFEDRNDMKELSVFDSSYQRSGKYSMKLLPEGFSYAYKLSLDTIWEQCGCNDLNISTRINFLANTSAHSFLVINVDSTLKKSWNAASLIPTTGKQWLPCYNEQSINRSGTTDGKLYVYVWNNGSEPVYLDDFILTIKCANLPSRKD